MSEYEYKVGDEVEFKGGSGAMLRKPGLGFVEAVNETSQWIFVKLYDGRRIGVCPELVDSKITLVTPIKL